MITLSPLTELLRANESLKNLLTETHKDVTALEGGKQIKYVVQIKGSGFQVVPAVKGAFYYELRPPFAPAARLFCSKPKDWNNLRLSLKRNWTKLNLEGLEADLTSLKLYRVFVESVENIELPKEVSPAEKVAFSVPDASIDLNDPGFIEKLIAHLSPSSDGYTDRFGGRGRLDTAQKSVPIMGPVAVVSCGVGGNPSLLRYGLGDEDQHGVAITTVNRAVTTLNYLNSCSIALEDGKTSFLHLRHRRNKKYDHYYYSYVCNSTSQSETKNILEAIDDDRVTQASANALSNAYQLKLTGLETVLRVFSFSKVKGTLSPLGTIDFSPQQLENAVTSWRNAVEDMQPLFKRCLLEYWQTRGFAGWRQHTAPLPVWYSLSRHGEIGRPATPILEAFITGDTYKLAGQIFENYEQDITRSIAGMSARGLNPFSAVCLLLTRSQKMDRNSIGWKLGRSCRLLADAQKEYHYRVNNQRIERTIVHQMLQTILNCPLEFEKMYSRMLFFLGYADAKLPYLANELRENVGNLAEVPRRFSRGERMEFVIGFNYKPQQITTGDNNE